MKYEVGDALQSLADLSKRGKVTEIVNKGDLTYVSIRDEEFGFDQLIDERLVSIFYRKMEARP